MSFCTLYRRLQVGCGEREIKIWVDWLCGVIWCHVMFHFDDDDVVGVQRRRNMPYEAKLGKVGRKYVSESLPPLRRLNPWPLLLRGNVYIEKLGFGLKGPKLFLGNLQILGNRPSALIVGNRVHRGPRVFEIVCCMR